MRAVLTLLALAACATSTPQPAPEPAAAPAMVAWTAPSASMIPAGPDGDAIRRGEAIARGTAKALPEHVGASMSCASCHLGAGTTPGAFPWVGVTHRYPRYRARSGTEEHLPKRINDCFERSLNGAPLPVDGEPMRDLVAYMTWLSEGVAPDAPLAGVGLTQVEAPQPPDATRGQAVYAAKCQACHQANGEGITLPDGTIAFPPLWGDKSFNIAAGMARHDTAVSFVYEVMPLGQGRTLTPQEAHDVVAYFTTQPRPDFAAKVNDWPKGGKPADARY
jgi:thiosulfate dehydrogenase